MPLVTDKNIYRLKKKTKWTGSGIEDTPCRRYLNRNSNDM